MPINSLGSLEQLMGMAHGIPHQLMGQLMRSTVWADGQSLGVLEEVMGQLMRSTVWADGQSLGVLEELLGMYNGNTG